MILVCDTQFAHAVRRAARGDGAELAAILRSDYFLGPKERELLAEFVDGELAQPHGGRAFGAGRATVVAAIARYRSMIIDGMQAKKASGICAEEFDVSTSTIRRWLKMVIDRERDLSGIR